MRRWSAAARLRGSPGGLVEAERPSARVEIPDDAASECCRLPGRAFRPVALSWHLAQLLVPDRGARSMQDAPTWHDLVQDTYRRIGPRGEHAAYPRLVSGSGAAGPREALGRSRLDRSPSQGG